MPEIDFLVVGSGFSGSVVAERLASAGRKILIIDKLPHPAGNAFDEFDEHGTLVHRYGPHIFHTQSEVVFNYLSRFTEWLPYEHRVRAMVDGKLYPIPINQTTLNTLYNLELDEKGAKAFYENVREERTQHLTSEDVVVGTIGWDLYNKFFKGYTKKQWGLDPSELSASVISRVPARTNRDDRYFTDKFQAMPLEGYTKLFNSMLNHKNIQFEPGVNFFDIRKKIRAKHIIYTGPIDQYYKYTFGKLPYRSLRFEHIHYADLDTFQPVAVVNYPNDNDYTRITEFKHLTGQIISGTSIVREYPQSQGDPYYPIPRQENANLFNKYYSLAKKEKKVSFLGRLAQYRYYNMDQVVAAALALAEKILGDEDAA